MEAVLAFLEAALKLVPVVVVAAPLIALLIDTAKKLGALKDGQAGIANLILNAAFWIGLYIAGQLGVQAQAEEFIQKFAEFAPAVVALILGLVSSQWFHNLAAGKGFGYSFSGPLG
jgi:hypothetical protein